MSTFRTFSEIVATMIQRLQLTQPNLDTKPGSVARDLFVDVPADQLARLYSAINLVSQKQSLATTSGRDLERLAANFGVARNTGSAASGIVVFCSSSINADVPIPTGTLVTARNGSVYRTIGNFVMGAADKSRLAANANRMRKALSVAGISTVYALEVPVQAVRNGSSGNISSLQVVSTNLGDTVSVSNLSSMTGGANNETDDSFRSRILSIFSGANIGTSFGYRNALIGVDGVVDALVVEPGNSLMLRDGTETMQLDDGSSRILNSGTGGKVDAYILGRKIQEVSDSYIFTDLSGSGDITDDRNDYILGQASQDLTRTSEERRIQAFKTGNVPAQPVDSIVTITGSSSGILTEAYYDELGNQRGNYILEKDYNPETGGSPFGFDKIRFISGTKAVSGEGVSKRESFGVESLAFSDINEVSKVYSDINEVNENSEVSLAGNNYLSLLHKPVVKVTKVINKTTGEVYSVLPQDLSSDGLNESGRIEITGRSLPSSSDILAVSYTWRHYYSPYIDYSEKHSAGKFYDENLADVINWSAPGGVFEEESIISKSDDGFIYEVAVLNNVNRPISVYRKDEASAEVADVGSALAPIIGIEISLDSNFVENIISIKRVSDGLELYNTPYADGGFDARVIYLPSDSGAKIGDEVAVHYNKLEVFSVDKSDGSCYEDRVTLPSEGILESAGILADVESLYFSLEPVYVSYVAESSSVHPNTRLSGLPITASATTNSLVGLDGFEGKLTNQPISYTFGSGGSRESINRYGAAPLLVSVSGISSPGKIRLLGETLLHLSLEVTAGLTASGRMFNLEAELKSLLGDELSSGEIGIAKINRVSKLDSYGAPENEYDTFGSHLQNIEYSLGTSSKNSDLEPFSFELPESLANSEISLSSGDKVLIDLFLYNSADYEEVYYDASADKVTTKRFARVSRISVSSGFRTGGGGLSGSLSVKAYTQPSEGSSYFVSYDFVAPKEGERLAIAYNINRLVIDATANLEAVRPITADVLVKEAEELLVDVTGTILINDEAIGEADRIVDSVINSVTNLLNTSRLGPTIDYSDVVSIAATQNGVDSVNVAMFNEAGKTGRKAFIKALDNQTISPGSISFEAVARNKFRIN